MKTCIIAPEEALYLSTNSHMCLVQEYIEREEYAKYYRAKSKKGDFVILDNGAFELGKSVCSKVLREVTNELKPTFVVLPDSRFQYLETMELVKEGISQLFNCGCKYLAVPQGKDLNEVLRCYQDLYMLQAIDGFAIYEEIGQVCKLGSRFDFLNYLAQNKLAYLDMYHHALGGSEDISEDLKMKTLNFVSSIDTAKPIIYGLSEMSIAEKENYSKYPHRPKGYFDIPLEGMCDLVFQNVELFKKWFE